jgi:putative endonuclease
MQTTQTVGRRGEDLAAEHLHRCGWQVLDRNWRDGTSGELDLVALDGDELVAVEVKTRRTRTYGHPAEAVTAAKLARLRRLTAAWLAAHDVHPASVRIDVLALTLGPGPTVRLEHLVAVG